MGQYDPSKVRQFLDSLTKGTLTREQLESIRDYQVQPNTDIYTDFFDAQIDALICEVGYGKKLAEKANLVEIHKSGELVGIGFLTGGSTDNQVITPQGLRAATDAYKSEGQNYHRRTSELSNLDTVFQNHNILIPLARAGVIDLDQEPGANPIFRSGYSSLFGAASESE